MEELLASIRKAIQDDVGEVPGIASGPAPAAVTRGTPPAVSGAMRELRVRVADEVTSASAEIDGLRDRIQRNRTAEAIAARDKSYRNPAPPSAPPGPFSAALAGQTGAAWRPARQPEPEPPRYVAPPEQHYTPPRTAPPLRPSFAESDTSPAMERPRPAPAYHQGRFAREVEAAQEVSVPAWRETPAALPPPDPAPQHSQILSDESAYAASSAFNRLAESLLTRSLGDRPVEDLARDMLRSMLKQWLDENLPALVERLVREEIERVARRNR